MLFVLTVFILGLRWCSSFPEASKSRTTCWSSERVYIEHNVRLWDFGCYVVVLGFLNADGCGRDLPRAGVVKKKINWNLHWSEDVVPFNVVGCCPSHLDSHGHWSSLHSCGTVSCYDLPITQSRSFEWSYFSASSFLPYDHRVICVFILFSSSAINTIFIASTHTCSVL